MGARPTSPLLDDLAAEIRNSRLIEPQLSITEGHSACKLPPMPDSAIAAATCQTPRVVSPQLASIASRAARAARAAVDPDALHAAGLIDLLWGDGGAAADRAVVYLTMAAQLSDRPASALSDLAAAYLVRAGRNQDGRDLMMAVDAAARAVVLEPNNAAAQFNLALALDRLGLDDEAKKVGSTSGAREATLDQVRLPSCGAPESEWRQAAIVARQQIEMEAWDHILGDWGRAVQRGDTAAASSSLDCAALIAQAVDEAHGDLTVPDAVRVIRARLRAHESVTTLARAHTDYADARARYLAGDYTGAMPGFAQATALASDSPSLSLWCTLFHASTLVYNGHSTDGERIMRAVIARADTLRYPALAGRARWSLGTTLNRSGRTWEALRTYGSALSLVRRDHETENVGALYALRADVQFRLGGMAAYTTAVRALAILRHFRASVWLHGTLNVVATALASDGLQYAALSFENEQIGVAERTAQRVYVVDARLGRARLLNDLGWLPDEASRDLRIARSEIDSLPAGLPRDWFRANAAVTEAEQHPAQHAIPDTRALDSAIGFFDGVRNHAWLIPALVDRANLRFDRGDTAGGAEDLSHVLAMFDRDRAGIDTDAFRVSVVRRTRDIAARLMLLRIASGHPAAALDILEHQRVAISPYVNHDTSGASVARHRGEVILDYAFVGDTLLTWAIGDTSVRFTRRTTSHTGWTRTVERARAALQLRAGDPELHRELASAYATLIEPVRAYIPPGVPLVVVADDDVQAMPFPALYDATRGRFLAEDHVLRFSPSVRDAKSGRPFSAKDVALLVADPAFDATEHPELLRLPGAAAEVDSIAPMYDSRTILEGSAATVQGITRSLVDARIWHYAGHAILDDEHPERSRLVLAGDALRASDIERLDLRHLDLVVLSACRTLDAQSNGLSGFSGLAASFLTAGAGGVIGSLWPVDDARTAQLMIAFHRAYRTSRDPAGALRTAQLTLLRSSDPVLRSPATWAAFRYAGR